jgi:hypothetical protein
MKEKQIQEIIQHENKQYSFLIWTGPVNTVEGEGTVLGEVVMEQWEIAQLLGGG